MAQLDLKPLSKETIEKMGFTPHDLWMIKIEDQVFGPFETQSLKHYSHENLEIFKPALVSRQDDQTHWQIFFELSPFHPPVVDALGGPQLRYWLLVNGQKVGPLSQVELDKKIESGAIALNDLASNDEGLSWHKLFHFSSFDSKKHESQELPLSPTEASFHKAWMVLVEKIKKHSREPSSKDGLASLVFLGRQKEKENALRKVEVSPQDPTQNSFFKEISYWPSPSTMAVMALILMGGYTMLTSSENESTEELPKEAASEVILPRSILTPTSESPTTRAPAREPDEHAERSDLTRHNVTHRPPRPLPVVKERVEHTPDQAPIEHVLVNEAEAPAPEEVSEPARDVAGQEPVIEEATDF